METRGRPARHYRAPLPHPAAICHGSSYFFGLPLPPGTPPGFSHLEPRPTLRAPAGFTFLSAVVCYTLKDAAERGRASASTFATLRRGLGLGCAAHLAVVSAKLIGIDGGGLLLPGRGLWQFYANAMAVPFAAATSLLMYGLVAFAAATPPREGVKERVLEGVDRLSSKVADKVADGVAEQLAQTDQDGAP